MKVKINSSKVQYTKDEIISTFPYETVQTQVNPDGTIEATPISTEYTFKTSTRVPKTGVMIVGLGGNNGTTFVGGIIANQQNLKWKTKSGEFSSNYYGSMTQCSTVKLGVDKDGKDFHIPFSSLLPMVSPNNFVVSGWDLNKRNLFDAMRQAEVFDYDLQCKLEPFMKDIVPLPSIYFSDFIASNQSDRADNILKGTHLEKMEQVRKDIRTFKLKNNLDKVIVLWSATTERFADVKVGLNDTSKTLLEAIARGD